jgi:hypothetical protein
MIPKLILLVMVKAGVLGSVAYLTVIYQDETTRCKGKEPGTTGVLFTHKNKGLFSHKYPAIYQHTDSNRWDLYVRGEERNKDFSVMTVPMDRTNLYERYFLGELREVVRTYNYACTNELSEQAATRNVILLI